MKIAVDVLERYTDLPQDPRELRLLLDDVGLEVKRVDAVSGPLVFTLELLANRGDHHCYEGVAREITGRTALPLRDTPCEPLDLSDGVWPLERHTDLVLTYTATVLVKRGQGALTPEQLRPLQAAGIHSISAPVDATNLANLEIGQPTHVFDADKVDGPIVIRTSAAGERAWPLFQDGPIEIPEGTLVIADRSKILAVAGVIGCEDSKATDASTRIVLESACFDPVAVRKASRALGIHTDSSARFERGADPERAVRGAGRVVQLLEGAGWAREGGTSRVGHWEDPRRTIRIDVDRTNAFLATDMAREEIAERLERYGFTVGYDGSALDVGVPSWRLWDVAWPADLYEELAKSCSYGATPIALPVAGLGALPSPGEVRRQQVDEVLVGAGFHEVFTDGFYGRPLLDDLGVGPDHPLADHVQTENALERGYSFLKNNCLGQAVAAVAANAAMRVDDLKLFEWTRTFHPLHHGVSGDRSRPPCVERHKLWAICAGSDAPGTWASVARPADGLFLKGIVEELAVELGLDLSLDVPHDGDPLSGLLHPGRQASITLDGQRVGILGEVHPAVCRRFKLKRARPCYLEIRAEALLADGSPPGFVEPPGVHPIERDLTFSLPPRVEADSVAAWLHANGPDWLERVTITACFEHEQDGVPRRAISYALRFTPVDAEGRGRTAEAVNGALESLVAAVHQQFGSAGVVQR